MTSESSDQPRVSMVQAAAPWWTENKLAAGVIAGISIVALTAAATAMLNLYNNIFTINNRLTSLEKIDAHAISTKLASMERVDTSALAATVVQMEQRMRQLEANAVQGPSVQNEINRLLDDLDSTRKILDTLRNDVTLLRERVAKIEGK